VVSTSFIGKSFLNTGWVQGIDIWSQKWSGLLSLQKEISRGWSWVAGVGDGKCIC